MREPGTIPDGDSRYHTDCANCRGLCCIAFAHAPENGFPASKPADQPCRHLSPGYRCGVFGTLEAEGYTVCRAYDCHGAGPLVSAWITADGAAPCVEATATATDRLGDFHQLARLHMLTLAARRRGDPGAQGLSEALDAVSRAYQASGHFAVDAQARAALIENEALVTDILSQLAPQKGPSS